MAGQAKVRTPVRKEGALMVQQRSREHGIMGSGFQGEGGGEKELPAA